MSAIAMTTSTNHWKLNLVSATTKKTTQRSGARMSAPQKMDASVLDSEAGGGPTVESVPPEVSLHSNFH